MKPYETETFGTEKSPPKVAYFMRNNKEPGLFQGFFVRASAESNDELASGS
jgi:hypothetical protein